MLQMEINAQTDLLIWDLFLLNKFRHKLINRLAYNFHLILEIVIILENKLDNFEILSENNNFFFNFKNFWVFFSKSVFLKVLFKRTKKKSILLIFVKTFTVTKPYFLQCFWFLSKIFKLFPRKLFALVACNNIFPFLVCIFLTRN